MYAMIDTASDWTVEVDAAVARALLTVDDASISLFGDSVGITGPDWSAPPESGLVTSRLRIGLAVDHEAMELHWRTTRVTQATAP